MDGKGGNTRAIPIDGEIRDNCCVHTGLPPLFIKPSLTLSFRTINWLTVKMTKGRRRDGLRSQLR